MYKAVAIYQISDRIELSSTDPETLEFLVERLLKAYKDADVTSRKLRTRKTFSSVVEGIEEDEWNAVAYWLFTMLCERDWQPVEFPADPYTDYPKYRLIKHEG